MAGVEAPCALIVMGVSGSGKSTVAEALGSGSAGVSRTATAFTPPAMSRRCGPATPSPTRTAGPGSTPSPTRLRGSATRGEHVIIACSALKHTYRDVLLRGRDDVRFVFLRGTQELIAARLAQRKGHFMPPGLLTSQFKTLEPPEAERARRHRLDR